MRDIFNDIITEFGLSVREYFSVLRLAILHTDHKYLKTSVEISRYEKSDQVYKCGIEIVRGLLLGEKSL